MKYHVIVHPQEIQRIAGTSKKGKPYAYDRQKVWIHFKDQPYPQPFNIDHWPDRETGEFPKPLEPGEYEIEPTIYGVSNFGELRFSFNTNLFKSIKAA